MSNKTPARQDFDAHIFSLADSIEAQGGKNASSRAGEFLGMMEAVYQAANGDGDDELNFEILAGAHDLLEAVHMQSDQLKEIWIKAGGDRSKWEGMQGRLASAEERASATQSRQERYKRANSAETL